jgi:hypothetical protein
MPQKDYNECHVHVSTGIMVVSHYTTPHSTTKETPFTMVYGADAMLPVEIDTPTWRRDTFSEEGIVLLLDRLTHFSCRKTNFTSDELTELFLQFTYLFL